MPGHAYSAQAASARGPVIPPRWSGPASAIGMAALCVVAMAAVWVAAALVPSVHFKDAAVLHDFTLLSGPRVDRVGDFVLHLLDPALFILWGLAIVAFALARLRPRVAVAVVAVMSLAPFTAETLKPLLAHSHATFDYVKIGAASWPSGHATAAMALVLSAVLAMPARARPFVAAPGVVFAAAVGCFLLIQEWHMPSDVLGGYLVATLWTALALAVLRAAERRWPTGRPI